MLQIDSIKASRYEIAQQQFLLNKGSWRSVWCCKWQCTVRCESCNTKQHALNHVMVMVTCRLC